MANFDFFKKFVFEEDTPNEDIKSAKHVFYRLKEDDIKNAEERIGRLFPNELRQFYSEIGYGFLCNEDDAMFDRIMDPESVADFYLGENIYEEDDNRKFFNKPGRLVFFEASEVTFFALDITNENENGVCPVYNSSKLIANSIEEFLKFMDNETDFYLKRRN